MKMTMFALLAALLLSTGYAQDPNLDLPVHPGNVAPVQSVTSGPHLIPGGGSPSARPGLSPLPVDDPRDEPPPVFFGEEIETENAALVFVIDISGSMGAWDRPWEGEYCADGQRFWPTRLDVAKKELTRSIQGLSSVFRFDIIWYDCGTGYLWPALFPATPGNKALAVAWVARLKEAGGTGTATGMARAFALDRSCTSFALLTDGAPNCGPDPNTIQGHRARINAYNIQRGTINVFGIAARGPGMREFCQGVATDSGGSYYDVP